MSADPPQLVVTLPARSVDQAADQVEEARRAGADLVEIRFDRWNPAERHRAAGLFPSSLPLIATLRSRAEGGEGPDDPRERAAILARLLELPFHWVDFEAGRDDPSPPPRTADSRPGVIWSTHFPKGTPVADVLRALEAPVPPRTLRKLVLPATTGVAVTQLVPAIRGIRLAPDRVLHTTGGSGPLLRALGQRLGMPLVYACLPEEARSKNPDAVEPAQIPVDRLRRFFGGSGERPLYAVLGHPVFHSLSPAIHDRWMTATGRVGLYLPLDISTEEELEGVMSRLGGLGFRGLNITHPWKAAALALARGSSTLAKECGVANCLTYVGTGWEADNTDVLAMTRRLEELRSDGTWDGDRLTVLGAGGAARATLLAARTVGARATVVARQRAAAEGIARAFGSEVGEPAHPVPTSLVVHATSAGGESTSPLSIPLEGLVRPDALVLDWVYRAADPHLPEMARRAGARYESGERLLVYQAVASFARWWGAPPPTESVRAVLEEVGCAA
ncbi:MAG TPA: type I 3-dehydroquinate dehydratase [Thermoplasmata archaeon]|nr:type I 3-dehydroquinate dehydratase [Thermoplasmata archaeon]